MPRVRIIPLLTIACGLITLAGVHQLRSTTPTQNSTPPAAGAPLSWSDRTDEPSPLAPAHADAGWPPLSHAGGADGALPPVASELSITDEFRDVDPLAGVEAADLDDATAPAVPAPLSAETRFAQALAALTEGLEDHLDGAIETLWATSFDLGRELDAIAALQVWADAADTHTRALARDALADLHRHLSSPAQDVYDRDSLGSEAAYLQALQDQALGGIDPSERLQAIAELGAYPTLQVAQTLEVALTDPEPANRAQAVSALGQVASSGVTSSHILSLLDTVVYTDVREVAAAAQQEAARIRASLSAPTAGGAADPLPSG